MVKLFMFVLRLSHLGRAVHVAYANQAQESFIDGPNIAFERLGGISAKMIHYEVYQERAPTIMIGLHHFVFMKHFTKLGRVNLVFSLVAYLLLTSLAIILYNTMEQTPTWSTGLLGNGAAVSLIAFFGVTGRATRRQDQEGVERENAASASMVTVLVIVASGFSYSLLEAFAGAPRVTAVVVSA